MGQGEANSDQKHSLNQLLKSPDKLHGMLFITIIDILYISIYTYIVSAHKCINDVCHNERFVVCSSSTKMCLGIERQHSNIEKQKHYSALNWSVCVSVFVATCFSRNYSVIDQRGVLWVREYYWLTHYSLVPTPQTHIHTPVPIVSRKIVSQPMIRIFPYCFG